MSDERFRQALGEGHPLVRAVDAWTFIQAHRAPLRGAHPVLGLLNVPAPEFALLDAERLAKGRAGLEALRAGLAILAAHGREPPEGVDPEGLDAMEPELSRREEREGWEVRCMAAARRLRAYGFRYECDEYGRPRPGKGGGEPMPRETRENGGRTLFVAVVAALVDALDLWDGPDDAAKRTRIADHLPAIFAVDPGPKGPLAGALTNLQNRRRT